MNTIAVIGGGLAGCECALRAAGAGLTVTLFEQKPAAFSSAHSNPDLAELVCSNSLRSDELRSGVGLLKQELRELGSAVMRAADATQVPAGKALAVDRDAFAAAMTAMVETAPGIALVRRAVHSLHDPVLDGFDLVVLAAGPLASPELCASLVHTMAAAPLPPLPPAAPVENTPQEPTVRPKGAYAADHLYFYDAIAPIVSGDSIDMNVAFWGSRYGELDEPGDYLNCPMSEPEYRAFYDALMAADKVQAHAFEQMQHFEGCMPIEALAERGDRTLTFGPLKPVGFIDPRTGRRPYALLQLRPENLNRSMFNLVGCQTKLTHSAQDQVFRLVPGLEQAVFVRHGSMHRNTYVNAPQVLDARLALRTAGGRPVHLAGQITGVEGYVESAACGLWLGMLLEAAAHGRTLLPPPPTTALGALMTHLQTPSKKFQPSNVHFGLMPEPDTRVRKKERKALYTERAREDFALWLAQIGAEIL